MSESTEPGSYFVANYPPFERWTAAAVPAVLEAFAESPTAAALGLYLHGPFCRKRCKFCYFRVYTDTSAADVERASLAGFGDHGRVTRARTAARERPYKRAPLIKARSLGQPPSCPLAGAAAAWKSPGSALRIVWRAP